MGEAVWGADPEFFGPRHAHREGRITRRLAGLQTPDGPHLECAAGVGSLSLGLARDGRNVVAADSSLRSLSVVAERARSVGLGGRVMPVVADITRLPFPDVSFASATSAETLEHIHDHELAIAELGRVLAPGGWLVGTVPAGPGQWSEWDDWAGHRRRYEPSTLQALFAGAGLEAEIRIWGWPLLRLYDALFLKRINRRRLLHDGPAENDPTLRQVAGLGRRRRLVALVRLIFELDRLFDGSPWGVGLLFAAGKAPARAAPPKPGADTDAGPRR